MSGPPDINSPAYKKALRRHNKSKKTPAQEQPALRLQEKHYKTQFPPPSLIECLDPSWNEDHGTGWRGSEYREDVRTIGCREGKKALMIKSLPGFVLLPGYLSPQQQRALISKTLECHAKHPNENNLDTHFKVPHDGLWASWRRFKRQPDSPEPVIDIKASAEISETAHVYLESRRSLIDNNPASIDNFEEMNNAAKPSPPPSATLSPLPLSSIIRKLRWSNIGYFYHWGTKSYQFDRLTPPIPEDIDDICKKAVQDVHWEDIWGDGLDKTCGEWEQQDPDWKTWPQTYAPDAGIINFYQLKDTLMAHIDRSELSSTSPLVSISLGQAAVFLIGGLTRDEEAIPIILRSGDVLIMSGPRCRRAFHGVPRILEGSLPSYLKIDAESGEDWELIAEYLSTARININVRQVFPPGFPYDKYGLSHLQNTT